MAAADGEDSPESLALALEHAWAWFSLHSGQRLQLIAAYLVGVGLFATAYVSLNNSAAKGSAAMIAGAGVVFSLLFDRFDARSRRLITIAEPAIEEIEKRLAAATGLETVRFIAESRRPGGTRHLSYGRLIRLMSFSIAVLFLAGLIYQVVSS